MSKNKLCRWECGRQTDRRCGICLECCNERDRHDSAVTAGSEVYLPPDHRPGHRFYDPEPKPRKRRRPRATYCRLDSMRPGVGDPLSTNATRRKDPALKHLAVAA
jgi:hypothetical protein